MSTFAKLAVVAALAIAGVAVYTFGWRDDDTTKAKAKATPVTFWPGERARARAYAEEYLSDGCDWAELKNLCRIISIRRLGGHVWRAETDGIGFKVGNFDECIDVDVASFAVYSTGRQDSGTDRFRGVVAIRC